MRHRIIPLTGLLLALLPALLLRLLLWDSIPRIGLISDEGEYLSAASWLALGRGFDWYQGYLWTRAPLYPLFLAGHLRLFGEALRPIYLSQAVLSLLNVVLVYALTRRLVPERPGVASLAALLTGLYFPLALYTQVLLSETLFLTLLLAGMLTLSQPGRSMRAFVLAGVLFGLASLTRSMLLGFLPIVVLWVFLHWPQQVFTMRLARPLAFGLAALLTIAPWTVYNSRIYGGTVLIDTSGAFNLLLGARTAYDGKRSDAEVRDYVLALLGQPTAAPIGETCTPFPGALPVQAARQQAMVAEGMCLLLNRPAAFLQKSLAELVDLFQINYTGAERFTNGFTTGRHHPAYLLGLFVLDDMLYVLALPLGIIGWAFARTRLPKSALVSLAGLWWLYNLTTAPLLFAINRFRVPLMPLLFIFAAYAVSLLVERFSRTGRSATRYPAMATGFVWLASLLALLLATLATAPYAYLEPRPAQADSRWASLLGPYPSSLVATQRALQARPRFLNDQRFAQAIEQHDVRLAATLLETGPHGGETQALGPALLAAWQDDPGRAIELLPSGSAANEGLAVLLRGHLLLMRGQQADALRLLSSRAVDELNPVSWAWRWLPPIPTRTINLGGSLDLGLIDGCYLGEGDTSMTPRANFRWCSDGMRLRFPGAGTGQPQQLQLRIDSRPWQGNAPQPPEVRVLLDSAQVGSFRLNPNSVEVYTVVLPASPAGGTVTVTLHSPSFVPEAARYNSQQSRSVTGQVQRLALRIDWAELDEAMP